MKHTLGLLKIIYSLLFISILQRNILVFLVSLLLSGSEIYAQHNIDGFYKGYITQNGGGIANKYYMEISISSKPTSELVGKTVFKTIDTKEFLVQFEFDGMLSGDNIIITEQNLDKEVEIDGYFCFKIMTLKFIEKGQSCFLQGSWTSTNCPTANGLVELKKELIY